MIDIRIDPAAAKALREFLERERRAAFDKAKKTGCVHPHRVDPAEFCDGCPRKR